MSNDQINNNQIVKLMMMDENIFGSRAITCLVHRKQKATHICTDLACQQNPLLCNFCFNDLRWRSQHPHESSIKPLSEGVQWLTSIIRSQTKSAQLLYERTIGSRQSELIKFNLQKGSMLTQQLDYRLDSLRVQLELELELLVKQFQKQIQIEKAEFARKVDQYKRLFNHNLDVVKRECLQLLNFQSSLKYYNNPNNFTLKLISETQKRSQSWLLQQKRILLKVSQSLDNPSFSSNLGLLLNRANRSNILTVPSWKGFKKEQIQMSIHGFISNTVNSWIQFPQQLDIEQLKSVQFMSSNKYITYPISI